MITMPTNFVLQKVTLSDQKVVDEVGTSMRVMSLQLLYNTRDGLCQYKIHSKVLARVNSYDVRTNKPSIKVRVVSLLFQNGTPINRPKIKLLAIFFNAKVLLILYLYYMVKCTTGFWQIYGVYYISHIVGHGTKNSNRITRSGGSSGMNCRQGDDR